MYPTQLKSHVQWWSNPLQQPLHSLQCFVLSGITIWRERGRRKRYEGGERKGRVGGQRRKGKKEVGRGRGHKEEEGEEGEERDKGKGRGQRIEENVGEEREREEGRGRGRERSYLMTLHDLLRRLISTKTVYWYI